MVANYSNQSLQTLDLDPSIDFIARKRRLCHYRTEQRIDNDFQKLLDRYKIDYSEYGYALGNIKTSFNAINKYSFKHPPYDEDCFQRAAMMLRQSYGIVKPAKLTFDYLDWMDKTTSPGYPWNLHYRTKAAALEDAEVYLFVADRVEKGSDPQGIYTNVCKSEPKKREKILNFNTRVITGAPIEVQAEAAYLFSTQNEYIHQAGRKFQIPSTVGMTHFYLGWHDLYRRLVAKSMLGLALDYTSFDGSITTKEFAVIRDVRFGLYSAELQTPELFDRITRYYTRVAHTHVIMETGDILLKHGGNPSGQVNTLTDNGMVNELRWYYMWNCSVPESERNLESFREHCELITCGDDSLISVNQQGRKWLTCEKLRQIGEDMGWHFKFEVAKYEPIYKLSYCSKHFVWYMGYVVPAPSNVQKTLASLLYGSKAKPDRHREALTRVLGIRMESFFLPQFRTLLEEYINFLFTKYDMELRAKPPKDMCSYSDMLAMKRDWVSMMQLYLDTLDVDDRSWHPALKGAVPPFPNTHVNDIKLLN